MQWRQSHYLLILTTWALKCRAAEGFLTPTSGRVWSSSIRGGTIRLNHILLIVGADHQPSEDSYSLAASPDIIEIERSKAIQAMESCSKVTAVSALVDLAVHGQDLLLFWKLQWRVSHEVALVTIAFLWKLSFAVSMMQVSRLYRNLPTIPDDHQDENDNNESSTAVLGTTLERLLDTMTRIWRQSSLMLILSASVNIVAAWRDRISFIREATIGLVVFGIAGSWYINAQEIKQQQVEAVKTSATTTKTNDSMLRIRQKGFVTVRSMLLCATALLWQAASKPLLVMSRVGTSSWQIVPALLLLLDIPTPLAIAAFLRTLRRSFFQAVLDLTKQEVYDNDDDTSNSSSNRPSNVQGPTQLQLIEAQQNFYGKVRSVIQKEMIVKVVVTLLRAAKQIIKV